MGHDRDRSAEREAARRALGKIRADDARLAGEAAATPPAATPGRYAQNVGNMLHQIIRDQLPRHSLQPDGTYSRSFDAKIFLDSLTSLDQEAIQERAIIILSMVGVYLKAGLKLADIGCSFSQEASCKNLQQLRDKMKSKKLGRELDYETVTVVLTAEQMQQLETYYAGLERDQMRR